MELGLAAKTGRLLKRELPRPHRGALGKHHPAWSSLDEGAQDHDGALWDDSQEDPIMTFLSFVGTSEHFAILFSAR